MAEGRKRHPDPPKSVVKCRGRLRRRRARWSACSRHETPHLTGCRGAEKWPQEVIYENTGTVIFDLGQCCVTLLTSRIMVWGGLSHGSALLGVQHHTTWAAAMVASLDHSLMFIKDWGMGPYHYRLKLLPSAFADDASDDLWEIQDVWCEQPRAGLL